MMKWKKSIGLGFLFIMVMGILVATLEQTRLLLTNKILAQQGIQVTWSNSEFGWEFLRIHDFTMAHLENQLISAKSIELAIPWQKLLSKNFVLNSIVSQGVVVNVDSITHWRSSYNSNYNVANSFNNSSRTLTIVDVQLNEILIRSSQLPASITGSLTGSFHFPETLGSSFQTIFETAGHKVQLNTTATESGWPFQILWHITKGDTLLEPIFASGKMYKMHKYWRLSSQISAGYSEPDNLIESEIIAAADFSSLNLALIGRWDNAIQEIDALWDNGAIQATARVSELNLHRWLGYDIRLDTQVNLKGTLAKLHIDGKASAQGKYKDYTLSSELHFDTDEQGVIQLSELSIQIGVLKFLSRGWIEADSRAFELTYNLDAQDLSGFHPLIKEATVAGSLTSSGLPKNGAQQISGSAISKVRVIGLKNATPFDLKYNLSGDSLGLDFVSLDGGRLSGRISHSFESGDNTGTVKVSAIVIEPTLEIVNKLTQIPKQWQAHLLSISGEMAAQLSWRYNIKTVRVHQLKIGSVFQGYFEDLPLEVNLSGTIAENYFKDLKTTVSLGNSKVKAEGSGTLESGQLSLSSDLISSSLLRRLGIQSDWSLTQLNLQSSGNWLQPFLNGRFTLVNGSNRLLETSLTTFDESYLIRLEQKRNLALELGLIRAEIRRWIRTGQWPDFTARGKLDLNWFTKTIQQNGILKVDVTGKHSSNDGYQLFGTISAVSLSAQLDRTMFIIDKCQVGLDLSELTFMECLLRIHHDLGSMGKENANSNIISGIMDLTGKVRATNNWQSLALDISIRKILLLPNSYPIDFSADTRIQGQIYLPTLSHDWQSSIRSFLGQSTFTLKHRHSELSVTGNLGLDGDTISIDQVDVMNDLKPLMSILGSVSPTNISVDAEIYQADLIGIPGLPKQISRLRVGKGFVKLGGSINQPWLSSEVHVGGLILKTGDDRENVPFQLNMVSSSNDPRKLQVKIIGSFNTDQVLSVEVELEPQSLLTPPRVKTLVAQFDIEKYAQYLIPSQHRLKGKINLKKTLNQTGALRIKIENLAYKNIFNQFQLGPIECHGDMFLIGIEYFECKEIKEFPTVTLTGKYFWNRRKLSANVTFNKFKFSSASNVKGVSSGVLKLSGDQAGYDLVGELSVYPVEILLTNKPANYSSVIELDSGEQERWKIPPVRIAVDLLTPRKGRLRGLGLDAELEGRIRLTGLVTSLDADGHYKVQRGSFELLGKRFVIKESDFIILNSQLQINLEAKYESKDFVVIARIKGSNNSLNIELSSTPDLPKEEIIARLLFNKGMAKITPIQTLQLADTLRSLGNPSESVMNTTRNLLNLDSLSLGANRNRYGENITVLEAGKYINDHVYVELDNEIGNTAAWGSKVVFEINPYFQLRGHTKEGDQGFELKFNFNY